MSSNAKRTITTSEGKSIPSVAAKLRSVNATGASPSPVSEVANSELRIKLEIGGKEPVNRTFQPGDVLVGRRPSNDLVIDGEGLKVVSGFHLRFAFESGRWCIEDKNSTNGTYINGLRTKGLQAVRDGDVVELGRPRKPGTYRAVKLTVALTGAAAAQATADFLPPAKSRNITGAPSVSKVPAAPATVVAASKPAPETAPQPEKKAAVKPAEKSAEKAAEKAPAKPAERPAGNPANEDELQAETKTVAKFGGDGVAINGTPNSKQAPKPSPPSKDVPRPTPTMVAPAPKPKAAPVAASNKVPAVRPAQHPSEIRALIGKVQDKSRRLGEVSYRLDAYVDDLASAAVERHVALGIADVPGGTAVIDLIAKEEQLNSTLEALESDLPSVRQRLVDELTPLEHAASSKKEASDAAAAQFKRSAKRRDEGLDALKTAFTAATAALRTTLAPVVEAMGEERASELSVSPAAALDPATDEPVWKYWSVALQSGMEEIKAREAELGAIRAEAADAEDLAATAEAEAKDAEAKWTKARKEADDRRIAIEKSVTEKEAIFAETTAQIGVVRDSMGATAKEFILSILGAPESASGSLGSLAGMKDARKLFQEVEGLRQELTELESGAY